MKLGCMVRKAIEDGILTEERLQSNLKLKKESKYEGMNSKQIEKEKISTMFSDFGGIKNARKFAKSKNKENKSWRNCNEIRNHHRNTDTNHAPPATHGSRSPSVVSHHREN